MRPAYGADVLCQVTPRPRHYQDRICEKQPLKSWVMRNEKFVRAVVWLVVIGMVLTLAVGIGSLLFS